jgi:hypothetical protein
MKYSGMTVNERLYISGLLQKFDDAVNEKDINKIIKILKEVELEESSINPILKGLGLNRNK